MTYCVAVYSPLIVSFDQRLQRRTLPRNSTGWMKNAVAVCCWSPESICIIRGLLCRHFILKPSVCSLVRFHRASQQKWLRSANGKGLISFVKLKQNRCIIYFIHVKRNREIKLTHTHKSVIFCLFKFLLILSPLLRGVWLALFQWLWGSGHVYSPSIHVTPRPSAHKNTYWLWRCFCMYYALFLVGLPCCHVVLCPTHQILATPLRYLQL